MKKCMIFFFYLVIFSSLLGCGRQKSAPGIDSQLVQQIDIHCDGCPEPLALRCTQPEKMRLILLCIRRLGPDFPSRIDVEALSGKTITLSLHCTDGSQQTYRLRNQQYLQKNHGPWRQINAENAAGLYQLLLTLADPPAPEQRRQLADFLLPKSFPRVIPGPSAQP